MWPKMSSGLHVTYLLLLSDFNENWIFMERFSKNTQISYFKKVLSVGVELFYADRRTDMTKIIVAFRYFANAPENGVKRDQLQFACKLPPTLPVTLVPGINLYEKYNFVILTVLIQRLW